MSTAVFARCSFCSKPNTEVDTLVAGPGVFICDGCVQLCVSVIEGKPADVPLIAPWEHDLPLEQVLSNLRPVSAASTQVQDNLAAWVGKARALGGTWSQIGDALGMTRQSAWERFA
ncbi:ClpX C4-type zinc finger protein [Amycolatopsis sp. CA-126428]|uniref:ClpX C4-type zinc finger protein n=1 Tax=Amycolatopsis sp. CA-126428 TaxID=2073158 RepID=UPI000CD29F71|nr:ClpX C4-type zinc finger protein [Amycolatopsis sp. CA-126428]